MSNEKSQSKSMLEDLSSRPSPKEMIEAGLLPESCALHLETALTYARMTKKAGTIDKMDEYNNVVIEHLQEIKKKVEAAGK